MKKNWSLLAVLSAIISTAAIGCGGNSPHIHVPGDQDNVGDLYSSVVALVKIEHGELRGPYCTAEFVSPTLLATAAHCVVHEETAQVGPGVYVNLPSTSSPIGEEIQFVTINQYDEWVRIADDNIHNNPEYVTAIVVGIDNENDHDVALLEIKSNETPSEHWLVMRNLVENPLIPGEEAYSIGMPVGQVWILTNGIISRIHIRQNGSVDILHQVRTGPGSSGSPIMDYKGRMVGVHTASWTSRRAGSIIGSANPISYIQTLVSIHETQMEIGRIRQISNTN